MIDKKLLDVLVCPKSKQKLILVGEELFSLESKLAYPINDGMTIIPLIYQKENSAGGVDDETG